MTAAPDAPLRRSPVVQGAAAATAFVLLLGLGTWQMERLRWKEGLLQTISDRMARPPVQAPAGADPLVPEYSRIVARGSFRHDLELHLGPRVRNGAAGVHLLTPLEREGAPAVLVNRGFVPLERSEPATRAEGLAEGSVRVAGLLRIPPFAGPFVPRNDPEASLLHRVDLPEIERRIGVRLAPYVLEADGTPNPGGLPVGGQTNVALRNAHLGYALTWYGLAAVLAVCMAVIARRRQAAP